MRHPRLDAILASAFLASLVSLTPAPAWTMPAPGDVEATDTSVAGKTGASSLSFSIETPPGTGGFAPQLSLVYSSQRGDGPFGVGWRLAGLSEIAWTDRFGDPPFYFPDSIPPFTGLYEIDDLFELDGQLLQWNDTEDRYHTYVESFHKITYEGAANGWLVVRPDGTKLRYGSDPNARIHVGGDPAQPVVRWLLREMEDMHGNVIRFVYDQASDPGTAYIQEISYTYRAGAPVGELRKTTFVYEPRPDVLHDFENGIERRISRRVREIQVTVDDQVFRRRLLKYGAPGGYATDRSRLVSTQLFGTDCPLSEVDPTAPLDPANCKECPRNPSRTRTPRTCWGRPTAETTRLNGRRSPYGSRP